MKPLIEYQNNLIADSRKAYKQAILSLLEPNEKSKLLDLGCGDGKLTHACMSRMKCKQAHGIDTYTHKQNHLEIIRGDLNETLNLLNNQFDVVIASHVIEHLWHTDRFAREIHRVLKWGGYVIVSTPNLASWHNAFYLLTGKQPETATISESMYPWKETPGHCRVFTATEVLKFFKFHQFEIEQVIGTSYYPFYGRAASFLARRDWKHAGMITFKARKK